MKVICRSPAAARARPSLCPQTTRWGWKLDLGLLTFGVSQLFFYAIKPARATVVWISANLLGKYCHRARLLPASLPQPPILTDSQSQLWDAWSPAGRLAWRGNWHDLHVRGRQLVRRSGQSRHRMSGRRRGLGGLVRGLGNEGLGRRAEQTGGSVGFAELDTHSGWTPWNRIIGSARSVIKTQKAVEEALTQFKNNRAKNQDK